MIFLGLESQRIESLYLGKVQLQNTSKGKFLTCCNLKGKEMKPILTILNNQKSITEVTIRSCDLEDIPDNILAQSLSRLRYLELCATNPTATQLTALFRALKCSKVLEELVVSKAELASVHPMDLALALTKVEHVTLDNSKLTTQQCLQILTIGEL